MIETSELTRNQETMYYAYLEAVDFTDTGDEGQPESGAPLELDFERDSLEDCLKFFSQVEDLIEDSTATWEQVGHDFWLTRNGHGTGFWDRPHLYGDRNAELLTEKAEAFGEAYSEFEG